MFNDFALRRMRKELRGYMATEKTSVPPRSHFGTRGVDMSALDRRPVPKSKRPAPSDRDGSDKKRTMAMTLVAVGAGAFGLWAFAASGSTKDAHGKIYSSVGECAHDGALALAECQSEWRRSLALHADYAPVYPTVQACVAAHGEGKCIPATESRDAERRKSYIPTMSGYFMGKLITGGYQSAPLYKLKADEGHKHRMTAAPEPVRDAQGKSMSAYVWMSRTVKPAAAASAGRPLFASAQPRLGERPRPAGMRAPVGAPAAPVVRGGLGGATKAAAAGG